MSTETTPPTDDAQAPTLDQVWQALGEVADPEIPVVSLVELGVVRDVTIEGEGVTVKMTPTFSGCPAMHVMREDVEKRLRELGFTEIDVQMVLSPPWSTDMIAPEAREKLRGFGIAPPPRIDGGDMITLIEVATCPHCGSKDAKMQNAFGPTLCRTIWTCNSCTQPFEQFKPI
jgi:ring-1,2-phenylacetyl-CoA epoxidase subunit PaaD